MVIPRTLVHLGFGFLFSVAVAPGVNAAPASTVPPISADRVLTLPPIFVQDSRFSWHYAQLAGMEVLSCCDNLTTEQLIERINQLNQRLETFLPARFRVNLTVPTSYVFFGESQQPVDLQKMVDAMQQPQPGAHPASTDALTIRYLPNFRFWEQDELAVFFVVKNDAAAAGNIFLSPSYVRYALENRTPALPRWFIDGMMALGENSSLDADPIDVGSSNSLGMRTVSLASTPTEPKLPAGAVLVRLPRWMFGFQSTAQFARDSHWKSRLLPLAALFGPPPPPGDGSPGTDTSQLAPDDGKNQRYIRWWSQSALFIHWALQRGEGDARASFWKFVERASVEPVTEGMIKEYFGLNYAELEQKLTDYFPHAVQVPVQLNAHDSTSTGPVELRAASHAEIGRIKGNLERLEIAYVKAKFPELASKYLTQARRTLHQAYDHGDRDAGLLEALGLCECDAGNDAEARPFLEAAVQAGALRPRVYYELARVRYQSLRASQSAAKLTSPQTVALLELLFAARAQSPPLHQVYELIATVWLQSIVPPTRGNLAVLDEGLRLYPENLQLMYFTAVLNASYGYSDEAAKLIDRGLKVAPEGRDRERFLKLQSAIAAGPVKGS